MKKKIIKKESLAKPTNKFISSLEFKTILKIDIVKVEETINKIMKK